MTLHLTASAPALPAGRADVPPALEAVIARALRRRPENRYQSAAELLGDLSNLDAVDTSRLLAGASPGPPMRGVPVGADARVWRFAGLVAVSFVTAVAAIVTASVLLR